VGFGLEFSDRLLDFLLDLSDGFVYDYLHQRVRRLDLSDHRRWILDRLSGTLCIDELHLGRYTLLLATDPLQDLPVAFALVSSNDQGHMRGFLGPSCRVDEQPSLEMLQAEKFAKMIAFLKSPASHRVRTNNHVERVNRKLRHQEKARYKWRNRRTIVRFMVLLLDRYRKQERRNRSRWQDEVPPEPRNRSSPKEKPVKRVA
jgi:Transposase, Mutator family